MSKNNRVLFVEPIIAHYRRDTFKLILENNNFSSSILAGNEYEGVKPAEIDGSFICQYLSFKLLGHRFYYLKNALNRIRVFNPSIIVCSGVDFHHLHTLAIFLYAKLKHIKFVWWSHGGFGRQGKLGKSIRAWFYRRSDFIFAYSGKGVDNLLKLGVKSSKVLSVGNAIGTEDYGFNYPRKDEKKGDKQITLLFSGRINQKRRIEILLHAIKELKEIEKHKIKCVVIGDGDTFNFKKLSNSLGISDDVEFVGPKYGSEVVEFFQNADIFVFPSGIGLSILHAFSYGLPVITTDRMDLHSPEIELLKPGINGDFFQHDNYDSLAKRIDEWAEKIISDKKRIANECIKVINEMGYLPEMQSRKIIDVLNRLIQYE
jgi:glycosyltransferase involved in cell wall biosynthesis